MISILRKLFAGVLHCLISVVRGKRDPDGVAGDLRAMAALLLVLGAGFYYRRRGR